MPKNPRIGTLLAYLARILGIDLKSEGEQMSNLLKRWMIVLVAVLLFGYAGVFVGVALKTGTYEPLQFLLIPLPIPFLFIWSQVSREEDL